MAHAAHSGERCLLCEHFLDIVPVEPGLRDDGIWQSELIGLGVDQIITDDPKLLGEVIKERAALSQAELVLLRLADIAENRISIR